MRTPMSLVAALLGASFVLAAGGSDVLAQPTVKIEQAITDNQLKLEVGETRLVQIDQKIIRIAVADPDVCDVQVVTPKQVLVTSKKVGFTHITLWGDDDVPATMVVTSERNLDQLRRQLKELFPGESLKVSSAGELLVLSGKVSDLRLPARAAEVAKLYSEQVANLVEVTGDQQVQLDVRFAEVSRTGVRKMGMDFLWNDAARDGGYLGGVTERTPALDVPSAGAPPIPSLSQGVFNFFFSTGLSEFPFSAVLSILRQEGLAKILSEPTLVAMSGQEAEFHAGGELPVLTVQNLGQVNVQFKKFGVRLRFKPTVLGNRTISLKLYVEVSEPDEAGGVNVAGFNIPAFKARSSETTIRLKDGQSFAVAGLLSDDTRQIVRKVPLLGDIPVLGALFRSVAFQREETELMVVVTGRLVRPLTEDEVPLLPGEDDITDPGDLELFLIGNIKSNKMSKEQIEGESKKSRAKRARERRGEDSENQGSEQQPAPATSSGSGSGPVAGPMGFSSF